MITLLVYVALFIFGGALALFALWVVGSIIGMVLGLITCLFKD